MAIEFDKCPEVHVPRLMKSISSIFQVNEEPFSDAQLDAMAGEFESFQAYTSPVGRCMELERWPWLVHLPLPRYNHLKKHRQLLWDRSKSILENRRVRDEIIL